MHAWIVHFMVVHVLSFLYPCLELCYNARSRAMRIQLWDPVPAKVKHLINRKSIHFHTIS